MESGRRKIRLGWAVRNSGRSGGGSLEERRSERVDCVSCLPTMLVPASTCTFVPFTLPLHHHLPHLVTKIISPSMLVRMAFPSYTPFPPYIIYILFIFLPQIHPQLTLRSRQHSEAQSDSDLFLSRFTSLTCLICRRTVYRVLQLIPPDMDSTEGPVLPTEKWVEDQVLQSGSGWIEMDKQCLVSPFARQGPSGRFWRFSQRYFAHLLVSSKTEDSVALLQFSQAYSSVFRVVLPTSHVSFPLPPPSLSTSRPPSPEPHQPEHPLKLLPTLSPLFPPPPFIPSHPTFDHLSAVAQQRSDQLRKDAEERFSRVVEACVSEIEKEEEELRRQVQLLWSAFREAESVLGQETNLQSPDRRSATADSAVKDSLSHTSQGSKRMSPVTVNDFVPVSTVRSPSPTHELQPSALSTSLAVSSFHHPKASGEERRSASPIATTLSSPLPTSPTLVGSVNYRDPVRRDMNENKDIATSFKYVVDMEAERSVRSRQYQSLSDVKSPRVNNLTGNPNPSVPDGAVEHPEPVAGPSTSENKAPPEVLSSPSGSKGKRKVTFDIKPVVPRGEGETQADGEPGEGQAPVTCPESSV